MTEKKLYTFRKAPPAADKPNLEWLCVKVDEDFNFIEQYEIHKDGKGYICTCPASIPWCRHLKMKQAFETLDKLGSPEFYDFDTKQFVQGPQVEEA